MSPVKLSGYKVFIRYKSKSNSKCRRIAPNNFINVTEKDIKVNTRKFVEFIYPVGEVVARIDQARIQLKI